MQGRRQRIAGNCDMTMNIVLSEQELASITGLQRPSAQARWLKDTYGIIAAKRPDGTLSVPRALYLKKAGIDDGITEREPQLRLA